MLPLIHLTLHLLLALPTMQAKSNQKGEEEASSTATVVFLVILLIVICFALALAWRRLVRIEGGEGYHPRELWHRAQATMQGLVSRWNGGEEEDMNISDRHSQDEENQNEENQDEENQYEENQDDDDNDEEENGERFQLHDAEPNITAL
ncbi:protein tyrosine phosphatase receptor type C-associated protein [Pelobates fuscus]|uniref:protein tyrosine phosphatase receptor type C-associated protein n=1 Tax=Pelobates fuscus TaxID=191477 RepID=UPI002FE45D1C